MSAHELTMTPNGISATGIPAGSGSTLPRAGLSELDGRVDEGPVEVTAIGRSTPQAFEPVLALSGAKRRGVGIGDR